MQAVESNSRHSLNLGFFFLTKCAYLGDLGLTRVWLSTYRSGARFRDRRPSPDAPLIGLISTCYAELGRLSNGQIIPICDPEKFQGARGHDRRKWTPAQVAAVGRSAERRTRRAVSAQPPAIETPQQRRACPPPDAGRTGTSYGAACTSDSTRALSRVLSELHRVTAPGRAFVAVTAAVDRAQKVLESDRQPLSSRGLPGLAAAPGPGETLRLGVEVRGRLQRHPAPGPLPTGSRDSAATCHMVRDLNSGPSPSQAGTRSRLRRWPLRVRSRPGPVTVQVAALTRNDLPASGGCCIGQPGTPSPGVQAVLTRPSAEPPVLAQVKLPGGGEGARYRLWGGCSRGAGTGRGCSR